MTGRADTWVGNTAPEGNGRDGSTGETVVLLEFPDEAQAYLAYCRRRAIDPSSARVISLDPTVRWWLNQHRVRCVDSLPYFTSAAHARALRKSEELLHWVESRFHLEDDLGVKRAYGNALLWYSRFFFHHMLWLAEILAEVRDKHQGAVWRAPSGAPNGDGSALLEDGERYLGSLAKEYCKSQELPFETIETSLPMLRRKKKDGNPRWLGRLAYSVGGRLHRGALQRIGRSRPLLSLAHTYRMDGLARQVMASAPELPWVFRSEAGGWRGVAAWVQRGFQAATAGLAKTNGRAHLGEVWLPLLERSAKEDLSFVPGISDALNTIAEGIEKETGLFSHRGVTFAPYLAAKIRTGIGSAVRSLHREITALDDMLELLRPRLVVTPFGRRAFLALGDLCRRRGIPGLLISHGSFTPVKNDLEEMGWSFHSYGLLHGSYSHAALQTPLAEAFARGLDTPTHFVRTGPLIWGLTGRRENLDRARADLLGNQQHVRVIVHAGTPKPRCAQHFHVYETRDEYVAALREVVLAVSELPDAFLIIKFRPIQLTVDELKGLLPESDRYCISVDDPFLDVLGLADLLISFSSTTIEEALQNRVPVLLYGGGGRYQHIEAFEVTPDKSVEPRAVYAVRRPEHLVDGLRRVLDVNGKAPLPAELFQEYVYKPEEITPFPDLVRKLVREES